MHRDIAPPMRLLGALVIAGRTWRFSVRVVREFLRNRGILLASGVGYNVLLSTVPLFALVGVLFTQIIDEQRLLTVLSVQAHHLAPASPDLFMDAVRAFLESRDVVGVVGLAVLLFFSSLAFRMLDDSIAIIFHQPDNPKKRRLWVTVVLPYVFVLVLGTGLLALTLLVAAADALNELMLAVVGRGLPLAGTPGIALNLVGFVGIFLVFAGIYKVLPVKRIAPRRALIGGFVAAVLWEGVRLILVYYFANISLVNAVYGSFATLIVMLLSLEIGAVILLLGAQVIAELERSAEAGVPWYESADSRLPPER